MNKDRSTWTRRFFLGVSGTLLSTACRSAGSTGAAAVGDPSSSASGVGGQGGKGEGALGPGGSPSGGASPGQGGNAPLLCTPSDDNILGPYYTSDAPFRDDLTEPGTAGVRVTVSGRVLDEDCQPIAGALLDVWQADHEGGYDNDKVNDPPAGTFVLRGRLNSQADGSYSFKTIIPGHYLNGGQYRPAHIHVKASASGYAALTTQLYFDGDPYNGIDPYIKPSLIMPLSGAGAEKLASFDFVLATA